jgi:hypothetical protein
MMERLRGAFLVRVQERESFIDSSPLLLGALIEYIERHNSAAEKSRFFQVEYGECGALQTGVGWMDG